MKIKKLPRTVTLALASCFYLNNIYADSIESQTTNSHKSEINEGIVIIVTAVATISVLCYLYYTKSSSVSSSVSSLGNACGMDIENTSNNGDQESIIQSKKNSPSQAADNNQEVNNPQPLSLNLDVEKKDPDVDKLSKIRQPIKKDMLPEITESTSTNGGQESIIQEKGNSPSPSSRQNQEVNNAQPLSLNLDVEKKDPDVDKLSKITQSIQKDELPKITESTSTNGWKESIIQEKGNSPSPSSRQNQEVNNAQPLSLNLDMEKKDPDVDKLSKITQLIKKDMLPEITESTSTNGWKESIIQEKGNSPSPSSRQNQEVNNAILLLQEKEKSKKKVVKCVSFSKTTLCKALVVVVVVVIGSMSLFYKVIKPKMEAIKLNRYRLSEEEIRVFEEYNKAHPSTQNYLESYNLFLKLANFKLLDLSRGLVGLSKIT